MLTSVDITVRLREGGKLYMSSPINNNPSCSVRVDGMNVQNESVNATFDCPWHPSYYSTTLSLFRCVRRGGSVNAPPRHTSSRPGCLLLNFYL